MEFQERENILLDAAGELIAHYGYDKTTVNEIAERARVSKGAVYLHWSSKENLFTALLTRQMRRLLEDLRERIAADPQGGTLSGIYRQTLLTLQRHPLIAALYLQDARILGDWVRSQDPARYGQRVLFGVDFVRAVQAAGLIRSDLEPETVAYLMAILSIGFMNSREILPPGSTPELERVIQPLADMVERGLGGAQNAGPQSAEAGKAAMLVLIQQILDQYDQLERK